MQSVGNRKAEDIFGDQKVSAAANNAEKQRFVEDKQGARLPMRMPHLFCLPRGLPPPASRSTRSGGRTGGGFISSLFLFLFFFVGGSIFSAV